MDTWMIIGIIGWTVLSGTALFRGCRKELTEECLAVLLILAGFLLRLLYVLYTPVTARQHDVYLFSGTKGHAGYIMHFYHTLRLPDFAPNSVSQFYHPPLHHFLEALWMRLQTTLGVSLTAAAENTQLLTLLYSSLCMPVVYQTLKLLKLRGRALLIPLAILCFHPTFILMAGSINNDILMTLLTLTAFWAALRWYEAPSVKRILPVALAMGFAMMAKLSAFLAAPAIGLLFLMRLFSDCNQNTGKVRGRLIRRYLFQFALFALICCPLGLWWPLYSYFVWNVPLGYVPSLPLTSHQYIGDHSLWERLWITKDQLSSVYVAWADIPGHTYYEFNLFTGLLKTSMFDESTLFVSGTAVGTLGSLFSILLFYVNLLLILLSVAAIPICLIRRYRLRDAHVTLSCLCLGLTVFISYISFCFGYPHTCTQNFRYAIPTLLVACLFLGRWLEGLKQRPSTALTRTIFFGVDCLTALFCIASAAVYGLLGLV